MFLNFARARLGVAVLVLAGLSLAGCSSGNKNARNQNQQSTLAAQVLTISPRIVKLNKDYPALLRSRQQVQVVARVNGILEKRYYEEGARVKKGQNLFTIEQAPYQATVAQRKASLASAKAKRYNAQITFNRTSKLYKKTNGKGTSKQAYDNDLASLKSAKASVQQAKAALNQAQINFNYTKVTAPVTGQISLRDVNVGNLVQSGQQLATITPLTPIEARFSLPIRDATALRRQRQSDPSPPVTAVLHSPKEPRPLAGRVDFLGSQVNQQTSTVQARATFGNQGGFYLPGQFVRVMLKHLRLRHVLAVPKRAVTQGQEGSQLYVLDKHNKVRPQQIDLGDTFTQKSRHFNHWVLVKQGLKPGARVVVNHIASVKAGIRIKPQPIGGAARAHAARAHGHAGQPGQGGTSQ